MFLKRLLLLACCLLVPFSAKAENLRALLQAPLLLGASVSADVGTLSPGKRLALRHTEEKNIHTLAQPGRNSLAILPLLEDDALEGRTIVIALDLFFWDSILRNPQRSVKTLKEFVQRAADQKIPLVLGEVPALLPEGKQPSRKRLNQEITRLCKIPHGCYIVPLAQLHDKIVKDGGLKIGDRMVPLKELMPDGLHLSEIASEYIADGLQEILER